MRKDINYTSLVIIETNLTEMLKQMDRDIFGLRKLKDNHDFTHITEERIQRDIETRDELQAALTELMEYESYIANYGGL